MCLDDALSLVKQNKLCLKSIDIFNQREVWFLRKKWFCIYSGLVYVQDLWKFEPNPFYSFSASPVGPYTIASIQMDIF